MPLLVLRLQTLLTYCPYFKTGSSDTFCLIGWRQHEKELNVMSTFIRLVKGVWLWYEKPRRLRVLTDVTDRYHRYESVLN